MTGDRPSPHGTPAAAPGLRPRDWPAPLHLHLAHMMLASGRSGTDMLAAALAGLEAYHHHPYRRPPDAYPVRASEGSSRLLDFGGDGTPVLFVPSLVNPAHILDLMPGHSLLAHVRAAGMRPVLLDWGAPGADERGFDIEAYAMRLVRFITGLATESGGPVALVGYCMGGTLAVAASLAAADRIARLALLAAPWDFHAGAERHRLLALAAMPLLPLMEQAETVPMALAQSFFLALGPEAGLRKYARFARLDPSSAETEFFVALEDWVNGGPPLAGPMAAATLRDWYLLNLPAQGLWRIGGRRVDPAALSVPVFAAVPRADRIVPPAGALGLCGGLAAAAIVRPASGHVGMIVGRRARAQLWAPLTQWLKESL